MRTKFLSVMALCIGLGACSESVPDITGKYTKKKEMKGSPSILMIDDYVFEKFDVSKFKLIETTTRIIREEKTVFPSRESIFVYQGDMKFCDESDMLNCFHFDKEKGIRFDGRTRFIPKSS